MVNDFSLERHGMGAQDGKQLANLFAKQGVKTDRQTKNNAYKIQTHKGYWILIVGSCFGCIGPLYGWAIRFHLAYIILLPLEHFLRSSILVRVRLGGVVVRSRTSDSEVAGSSPTRTAVE